MYTHLTKYQRIELGALLRAGHSLRYCASLFDVHHTTLSRELERNKPVLGRSTATRYHAGDAQRATSKRRLAANQRCCRILPDSALEKLLITKIRDAKWTPEQCSGWLKKFRINLYVCAQTIYDSIVIQSSASLWVDMVNSVSLNKFTWLGSVWPSRIISLYSWLTPMGYARSPEYTSDTTKTHSQQFTALNSDVSDIVPDYFSTTLEFLAHSEYCSNYFIRESRWTSVWTR